MTTLDKKCDGNCWACNDMPGGPWGHRGRDGVRGPDGIRATDEQWAATLNAVLDAWHNPETAANYRKEHGL